MSDSNGGWANPVPAGLISLAVAVFMFGAMFMGYTKSPGCMPIMGFWLLGAFFVQIVVAVIELKSGSINAGNVFLFFSAFFCFTTGAELIFKYMAIVLQWAPVYDGHVDGWAWLAIGIALIPITFCYLKKAPLSMNLMVFSLDFAVIFIVGMDIGWMSHNAVASYAGYGCFLAGIFAIYSAGAMLLNSSYGRTILPMGGPIIK